MMVKINKIYNSVIYFISKNKTFQNMNSSFSLIWILQGLEMFRKSNNFRNFILNDLFKCWILFTGFIDFSFTILFDKAIHI